MNERTDVQSQFLNQASAHLNSAHEESGLARFIEGLEPAIDWTGADQDTHYFTHGFHPYPARMAPHIARRLLRMYSNSSDDILLDPYCGSGGVLVEGMLYDRVSIGVDLNPLAILIAKVKTTPIESELLMDVRGDLLARIQSRLDSDRDYTAPAMRNVNFWFKPEAIRGLSIIRDELQPLRPQQEIYDFFRACFSLTVRKSSNLKNGEFKLYGKQGEEREKFKPNPVGNFEKITRENIGKMGLFSLEMQRHPKGRAVVLKGDTRRLLKIKPDILNEKSVKVVISSPPYGDSHTTVAYGQYSRYSSLWLDFPEEEVLQVDDMGMGGKIIRENADLESPTLNSILSQIEGVDEKRAREVYSFFYDADRCMEQIADVMVPLASHCCFVLANRSVRRVRVPADQIFIEIAKKYGLHHVNTLYRDIPNKHLPAANAPENIPGKTGPTMLKESIVIWEY